MENLKIGENACDIQLDLTEDVLSQAHLVQQNGQNQLIVFLNGDDTNPDLEQIRRAIFDTGRVNVDQGDPDVEGSSEQLVPDVVTSEEAFGHEQINGVKQTQQNYIANGNEDDVVDQFICGRCNSSFNNLLMFLEHGTQHKTDTLAFRCGLCSAKVNRLAALKQHYRYKHGLPNFLKPKQRSTLMVTKRKRGPRKIRQPVQDKTNIANDVDETVQSEDSSCMRTVVIKKPQSEMANQDFTFILCTNDDNDITTLKCLQCDGLLSDKQELVNHMKTFHPDKMGNSVLDMSRDEQRTANEHAMLMSKFIELTSTKTRNKKSPHWRERQDKSGVFTCSKCGKVFGRLRNLRRHMSTHSLVKSFLCSDCGRGFTTSTYLSLHRKTHKVKVFQCSQCDFTSSSNPAIHAHRQIHSQGSVLCDQCGYAYNDRATLLKHKEVHNMSRPFACTFPNCTWRFKTEVMCRAHIKAHTTEGKFKCNFCGYIFRHKHHLQRHETKIHGVERSKQIETTETIATEIPIAMETEVDQLQLHLQQPQQIVVTTDNTGTPITYEASDISGLTYQTLLQTQESQGQETCAIFVDSADGHIVFQNE